MSTAIDPLEPNPTPQALAYALGIPFLLSALLIESLGLGDGAARTAWVGILLVALAYEPVMVSRFGATLGHRARNLCVVDARTSERIGFFRACWRLVVKVMLGCLSLITLWSTRRSQTLHDFASGSVVCMRDIGLATPNQYRAGSAQQVQPAGAMPSKGRRLAVVLGYLVYNYVVMTVVIYIVAHAYCDAYVMCQRARESGLPSILSLTWIALSIVIIVQGVRGRLPGARAKPAA